jgi:FkbM family methyltransferase
MSQFNITLSIIYPLFKKPGIFVEVGGSHPFDQNNTFQLEERGWKGIVVEPLSVYNNLYKEKRLNTILENCAVISPNQASDSEVTFLYIPHCSHGSGVAELQKNTKHHLSWDPTVSLKVPCYPLDTILKKHNTHHIDFLSIDTEGYEHFVLEGLDFNKTRVNTILIEDHGEHIYKQFNQVGDFSYLTDRNFTLHSIMPFGTKQHLYINNDFIKENNIII